MHKDALCRARCCMMKIHWFCQYFVTTGTRRKPDMSPFRFDSILPRLLNRKFMDSCRRSVSVARNTLRGGTENQDRKNKVTPPPLTSLPLQLLPLHPMLQPRVYGAPVKVHRPAFTLDYSLGSPQVPLDKPSARGPPRPLLPSPLRGLCAKLT